MFPLDLRDYSLPHDAPTLCSMRYTTTKRQPRCCFCASAPGEDDLTSPPPPSCSCVCVFDRECVLECLCVYGEFRIDCRAPYFSQFARNADFDALSLCLAPPSQIEQARHPYTTALQVTTWS
jgi:hypothetical protein